MSWPVIVCRSICNEFYLNLKLNLAENTAYDAENLMWMAPAEVS